MEEEPYKGVSRIRPNLSISPSKGNKRVDILANSCGKYDKQSLYVYKQSTNGIGRGMQVLFVQKNNIVLPLPTEDNTTHDAVE